MRFEFVSASVLERLPVEAVGDDRFPAEGWTGLFVGHLQEEQVGELLQVVAVGETVVPQDVAVVPQLGDERLGIGHLSLPQRRSGVAWPPAPGTRPRSARPESYHRPWVFFRPIV